MPVCLFTLYGVRKRGCGFPAGAALSEGSRSVFPRSIHAGYAGAVLADPLVRAALWAAAAAATAAWLAAAAAALGLAVGTGPHRLPSPHSLVLSPPFMP